MTRGKHSTSSEARRAREEAVSTAARVSHELTLARARIAELESLLKDARAEVAAGASA